MATVPPNCESPVPRDQLRHAPNVRRRHLVADRSLTWPRHARRHDKAAQANPAGTCQQGWRWTSSGGEDSRRLCMPGPPSKKDKTPRSRLTVRLPVVLIERLRRVSRDRSGFPVYSTMAGVVEAGITAECDRLEAQLHESFGSDPTDGTEGRSPKHRRIGASASSIACRNDSAMSIVQTATEKHTNQSIYWGFR